MIRLVDSHCHLDFDDFAGRMPEILAHMASQEVERALCVSINLQGFPKLLALAQAHPELLASCGVHPDQDPGDATSVADLLRGADDEKVVAIGETGLDYYRQTGDCAWQRERFRVHIRAALECAKPLIVHTRDAGDDTLAILREESAKRVGGVMHCFTESLAFAQAAMELNFLISFSGIVTFKNAQSLKEVAKVLPLDRVLVETDAPYLAPVPHRGKTNEPAYVRHVAEAIADLRGIELAAVAAVTTENFDRLFCRKHS